MRIIADIQLHSKYSRATSPRMNPFDLEKAAEIKGIDVIGTGDFTHPKYIKELKDALEPTEPGLFKLKNSNSKVRFMLTSEISCIYTKGGRGRRAHHCLFAPDFKSVESIITKLSWVGNLASDGRPIIGIDSKELLKIALEANAHLIPAHAWTPWFSVFGSMSGFNSLEECFNELTPHIFAIETGLSSDPAMNWRLSQLDKISLISNSDAHSLEKIGREANVFDCEMSFDSIFDAIKSRDPKKFLFTIEFFPEEGKYHYDGHRSCGVVLSPQETKQLNNLCPKCGRKLTLGVAYRVDDLADREVGFGPKNRVPFKNVIPLMELIAAAFKTTRISKKAQSIYDDAIRAFKTEFNALIFEDFTNIKAGLQPELASIIYLMRQGKIKFRPGFDGEYGKIELGEEIKEAQSQLF